MLRPSAVRRTAASVSVCVLVAAGLSASAAAATAAPATFAPVDTPGPPLNVPAAKLDGALACSSSLATTQRAPVLLVQGTGATAKDNWSWTYEPALDKLGIAWCAVDLPEQATADVQLAGEYVVHAIRTMHARVGRKISIIGHSQGGMVPRWALRFWPDTRSMVDDLVGFAPSNHGTTTAAAACNDGDGCSEASWQQSDVSTFMKALNSRQETFKGISYTSVYTRTDQTVQPNQDALTGSSSLRTGDGARTNVATQDICPAAVYDHLLVGLIDPVAYALAVDALTHEGPADPARVSRAVCAQVLQPGINPVTFPRDASAALISFETFKPRTVRAEPALACYTTASCPSQVAERTCVSTRRFTKRVPKLRGVRATLNGRALRLRRVKGQRVVIVDLRGRRGPSTVTLRFRGRSRTGRKITRTHRYRTCTAGRA